MGQRVLLATVATAMALGLGTGGPAMFADDIAILSKGRRQWILP